MLKQFDSDKFSCLKNIIKRESVWVNWKINHCPRFERVEMKEVVVENEIEIEEGEVEEQKFMFKDIYLGSNNGT